MELFAYLIVFVQLGVVTLIAWATGNGSMFTHPAWRVKVWFLYHISCTRSVVEDLYFRSRQKEVDCSDKAGCVAVVTGGGRGLGYHISRGLVERGMHVIVGVRNPDNYKAMKEAFHKDGLKGSVEVMTLDTSSVQSVREFALAVRSKHPALHVLVNNAGPKFAEYDETEDGFETTLATNYLGHFLLTHSLVGSLERGGRDRGEHSRVVNMSSMAHGAAGGIQLADLNMAECYSSLGAYAHSKLALIMFSLHLNRLLSSRALPIRSSSLHPGVVAKSPLAGLLKSEAEGARSALYCALDRATEPGAGFISNMRERRTSACSRDVEKQKQLFELTCKMLDIDSFGSKADI